MKIEVAKPDLERALSVTSIATGSSTDIAAHYLFRIQDGKLQILAADERLSACAPCVANVEGDEGDAFTVEAWRLNKWVGGVADGVLKLQSKEDGEVTISGGRSRLRLRSLDPARFPYWDGKFDNTTEVGSVDPENLGKAISVSRWFISQDDTYKPELCQVEAIDGVLWATDRRAVSSVQVGALPDLGIRILGKDVPGVLKFLRDKVTRESPMTIKTIARADGEGESALFYRPDGCYLGVTRPVSKFPELQLDRDMTPPATMTLDKEELEGAFSILSAGAPKGFGSVTFTYDEEKGVLSLEMPCEAGGENSYPLNAATVDGFDKIGSPFTVDYMYIKGLADTFGLKTLEFGVTKQGSAGFVSFRVDDPEDENGNATGNSYFSVIVWRT